MIYKNSPPRPWLISPVMRFHPAGGLPMESSERKSMTSTIFLLSSGFTHAKTKRKAPPEPLARSFMPGKGGSWTTIRSAVAAAPATVVLAGTRYTKLATYNILDQCVLEREGRSGDVLPAEALVDVWALACELLYGVLRLISVDDLCPEGQNANTRELRGPTLSFQM